MTTYYSKKTPKNLEEDQTHPVSYFLPCDLKKLFLIPHVPQLVVN